MDAPDGPYERKIQLTGDTTYTVSLPKEWANGQAVSAGTIVHVYTRGDRLLVTQPDTDAERRTVSISVANTVPERVGPLIAAAYVAGAETIRIGAAPDREMRAAVHDAVAGLVGIEVYAETDDELVARTMLDVADLSPKQTLVQMEQVALSMHEEAVEAALSGNGEVGRRIAAQDDTVDRLFALVAREFQRSLVDVSVDGFGSDLTTFDYFTVARQVERVADHAEKIAGTAELIEAASPPELSAAISRLGADARGIVSQAIAETLGDGDLDTLSGVITGGAAVAERTAALYRTLYRRDLPEGYLLARVLDSTARTAEYGVNVAEAGIQASLRRPRVEELPHPNG